MGGGKERRRNRKKRGGRTEGLETKRVGGGRERGETKHGGKNVGEKQKDEKRQTNFGKPNGGLEKLGRNLKTQGWELVVVAGGLISIRCR